MKQREETRTAGKAQHRDTRRTRSTARRQQEDRSRGDAFVSCLFCAVLGSAPLKHLPCPHWTLTLGLPLWCCRLPAGEPRHQSTSGSFARVLQPLGIVVELVGREVASASRTTAPPMPRQVVDRSGEFNWIERAERAVIRLTSSRASSRASSRTSRQAFGSCPLCRKRDNKHRPSILCHSIPRDTKIRRVLA